MLKRLLISSCAAFLLVGCSTTETKPSSAAPANTPAQVAQPAAKAVKPVLKPKAAVKPKAIAKSAESVPANSDAALSKQWASCAGSVQALYAFGQDVLKLNPSAMTNPRLQAQLADYQKFPMLRDSFYAYAAAANAAVTEAEFKKVYAYHYTDYTVAFDGLRQAIARGAPAQATSSKWAENYMNKVIVEAKKITSCGFKLDQNHTRFDAKVTPSLRYDKLTQVILDRSATTVTKKSSKKHSRKAS
jgi:hypothetical protein